MSNFHKVILPDFISIHLQGGPVFSNNIVRTISGREVRFPERSDSYQKYTLKNCRLSSHEFDILNSFFRNRNASLNAFLIKDFSDYKLVNQVLSKYDEEIGAYNIEKSYGDGIFCYNRDILFIEENSFVSNIAPEEIDFEKGLFYKEKLEENITISCQFYIRVRFNSDRLKYSYMDDDSILIDDLELVEI